MLAISQSSGISPVDKDWFKMEVKTGDISSLDSLISLDQGYSAVFALQRQLLQRWTSAN